MLNCLYRRSHHLQSCFKAWSFCLLCFLLCCATCNLEQPEYPAAGEAADSAGPSDEVFEGGFGSRLVGAVKSVGSMVSTVFNAEDKLPAFELRPRTWCTRCLNSSKRPSGSWGPHHPPKMC